MEDQEEYLTLCLRYSLESTIATWSLTQLANKHVQSFWVLVGGP